MSAAPGRIAAAAEAASVCRESRVSENNKGLRRQGTGTGRTDRAPACRHLGRGQAPRLRRVPGPYRST